MTFSVETIADAEYEAFLDEAGTEPGVVLSYHYPFYLQFLRDLAYPGSDLRIICARDATGRIAGAIPALHIRRGGVAVWLSLPYFGPNAGGIVRREQAGLVEQLVSGARKDAEDLGCDSLTICGPIAAASEPYRRALGDDVIEQARHTQVLPFSRDGTVSPWPSRVRADLRRAVRMAVEVQPVQSAEEVRAVWDIYEEHCREVAIPIKPWAHIERLYQSAGPRGLFLAAKCGGEIIAGLIAFTGGRVLSYYLPCTRRSARSRQPGLLLLDAAVTCARTRGCSLLNFESSPAKDGPVYRFKERCGGRLVPYSVFVKLLKRQTMQVYRSLGRNGLAELFPHAFVVPYSVLTP